MDIFEWLFENVVQKVLSALPLSPFQNFINSFSGLPYLGWLNWFFPVGDCLVVMLAWLGAVGLFYLYSVLMRWIKLIGD